MGFRTCSTDNRTVKFAPTARRFGTICFFQGRFLCVTELHWVSRPIGETETAPEHPAASCAKERVFSHSGPARQVILTHTMDNEKVQLRYADVQQGDHGEEIQSILPSPVPGYESNPEMRSRKRKVAPHEENLLNALCTWVVDHQIGKEASEIPSVRFQWRCASKLTHGNRDRYELTATVDIDTYLLSESQDTHSQIFRSVVPQ